MTTTRASRNLDAVLVVQLSATPSKQQNRRGFGVHRGFGVCLGLGVRRGGFRARRQVLQHVGERSLERFFVMNEKIIILPLILLQVVVAGRRFVLDLALALRGSDG